MIITKRPAYTIVATKSGIVQVRGSYRRPRRIPKSAVLKNAERVP